MWLSDVHVPINMCYTQGCQVFTTKPAQLLLKTSPMPFRGCPLVKIVFLGLKYTFFAEVPLVKFALQGLNITLLGALQSADIKTTCGNSVKVAQFHGKVADLATLATLQQDNKEIAYVSSTTFPCPHPNYFETCSRHQI